MKAKFIVVSSTQYVGAQEVNLKPVTSGSEENKSFSTYTPSGDLKLMITNPEASDYFKVGKEYYLDFTPVD